MKQKFQSGQLSSLKQRVDAWRQHASQPGAPAWAKAMVEELTAQLEALEEGQAEDALREASRFNEQIIASARDGIVVHDREQRYQVWNPFLEHLTGLSAGQVLGRRPTEVFPFVAQTGLPQMFARVLRGENPAPIDFAFSVPETGRSGWVSYLSAPLRNASGEIIGIISTVRDITERKRAEQALAESEARYHTLFDQTPVPVWEEDWSAVKQELDQWRAAGELDLDVYFSRHPEALARCAALVKVVDINQETLAFFGVSTKAEVPRHLPHFFHEGTWPVFQEGVVQLAAGKRHVELEVPIRELSGQRKWVSLRLSVQTGYEQSLGRVLASFSDITKLKRTKEALQAAERFTHATLDALSARICVVDESGRILAVNQAWRTFAQAHSPPPQRAEVGGNYLGVCDTATGADSVEAPAVAAGIRAVLQGKGNSFRLEYPCHSQAEKHWFVARVSRLPGPGPALCVIAHEEITYRKLAEEELRVSREQLRALAARVEAVREEERTQVAREIHDVLAQELTRLKLDLAWLNRRLSQKPGAAEPGPLKDKLAAMLAATDTAVASVQKIATELRPVVLDTLGLCAAIEWQAQDFETRTGIPCTVALPPAGLTLEAKPSTALFRILQESLTNVVRHARATRVEISLETQPQRVVLSIRDNGRGFEGRLLSDPRSLGLLGMRERAALQGGLCQITAQPGQGTAVEAWLPLTPTAPSADTV